MVSTCDGEHIGVFEFVEQDGSYLLSYMFLDLKDSSFTRQGIGTEILRFFNDETGITPFAREHTGMQYDDGSHLTGDAPGFVSDMQEKGLLQSSDEG